MATIMWGPDGWKAKCRESKTGTSGPAGEASAYVGSTPWISGFRGADDRWGAAYILPESLASGQ